MVDSKIKKAIVSAAKKNITASGVRIENGVFVDDEGSIVDRIEIGRASCRERV